MKTHEILRDAGYNGHTVDNFGVIAQYAARLEQGVDVLNTVEAEFGLPIQRPQMNDEAAPYSVYGDIDQTALDQMDIAMRLPVAVRGAVMPDAHLGYALNIGGVAQLDHAVSPSMVGYDIACRMTLTVLGGTELIKDKSDRDQFANMLVDVTHFGLGKAQYGDTPYKNRDHDVMYDSLWDELPHLSNLKDKAWDQLGSSGSGNHFANIMTAKSLGWTEFFPYEADEEVLVLLTHSGSRGTGYKMAQHYMKLAHRQTGGYNIPTGYEWLDTQSEDGAEYLEVMNLMGDYAQANHYLIHDHFLQYAGLDGGVRLENHHNFAWVQDDGTVIHRKGASPAGLGQASLIPGSAGTHSYIVEGLGNPDGLWSSSHGAGRVSSRTKAKQNYDPVRVQQAKDYLDVTWIGVEEDENPFAYKNIDDVMNAQSELVDKVAVMTPVVVIMGGK